MILQSNGGTKMTLKIYLYKNEQKTRVDKKPSFVISTANPDLLSYLHKELNSLNTPEYIRVGSVIFKKELFYCATFEK